MSESLVLAVAAPLIGAALAPLAPRIGRAGHFLLALIPATLFLAFASLLPAVSAGERITGGIDWLPAFGVRLSFLIDGLSLLFALLITGIGTFIVIYAGGYMKGHPQAGRFLAFLMLFMTAMLGLVLADDGITLFVFWEGTSISSFLLIGFDHTKAKSRRAALQALVITGLGGLALLAGVLLAGQVVGERSLSAITAAGDTLRASALYLPILGLFLLAAFTKSAQFPLHVWLPNAMEAPTPVSAYLHSATMVKAGVYLLMRLNPALGGTSEWITILPLIGGITLLVGGVMALRQHDLKLMLAQTTVASLGLLVMLTGIGSDAAILGACAYLLAHALFKGALFMVAGCVDHETGTRDIRRLSGLRKAMPITFGAALVAGISMAGLPPMFGFVAKEGLYYGLVGHGATTPLVMAVAGNAMMFAIAFAVGLKAFIGPEVPTPHHAHEGPLELWAGPVTLGAFSILTGLLTHLTTEGLLLPMAGAIAGHPVELELHLIPSYISVPLLLSALTVAIGVATYLALRPIRQLLDEILTGLGWGPDKGFDQLITLLVRVSAIITRALQSGRMEVYMTATTVLTILALLVPMVLLDELPAWPGVPALQMQEWAVVLIAALGLVAVLVSRTRLTAIVSLGVQGFAVAVLFMLFGAPDLSFTQFMVETLSVVILALVLTRLALGERDHRSLAQTLIDGTLAILVGFGFSALLLSVVAVPFDDTLTAFFEDYSYVIAHGRNVVNVIIVDFRGLDTLGEIAVVMITGLAILAMVKVKARESIINKAPEDRT